MNKHRKAAVAGSFYPSDPGKLRETIRSLIASRDVASYRPRALIAPHAGYIYSGPVAATAYAVLKPNAGSIRRVILLGPSHFIPFQGIAVPDAEAFNTPLGPVPVDGDAVRKIRSHPSVRLNNEAHRYEHSLEVHLPFLKEALSDFTVLPLAAGLVSPEEVASVLEALLDRPDETVIVVSSDLSHENEYSVAKRMDAETARAIEKEEPDGVSPARACGSSAVKGLLVLARRRGWRARTLDLRNSGDTAGPKDAVVGYGAFIFT